MSSDELNRFFTLMQDQAKVLKEHGETLATICQSQADTKERLFGNGNSPGAIPYLYERVGKHEKQLNRYAGALSMFGIGFTTALTYIGAWLSKHVK